MKSVSPTSTAAKIMSSPTVTIGASATVAEAATLMSEHRVGALPVVNSDGRYVGLITERSFLLSERVMPLYNEIDIEYGGQRVGSWSSFTSAISRLRQLPVTDVMLTRDRTVAADTLVSEVARRLFRLSVNHLIVVEVDMPVGVVARHDLVRMFAG